MTIDLMLIALAIALEPLPLTGYLVMLGSDGGSRRGLGFLPGWAPTLVGVVVLTLVLTGGKPLKSGSAPSTAVLVAKIALGLALLWLARRQRARRERPAANLSHATSVAALIAFCILATVSYLVMQAYVTLSPESARVRLAGLNDWIMSHRDQVIIAVCVGLGAWLIDHSIYLLGA